MSNPIYKSAYNAAQIEAAIGKGPRVNASGYWEVWNVGTMAYESTGVGAGVKPPTVVTQASQMTNHGYIYIYEGSEDGYTPGYFYYWNGSAWTPGGAYRVAATDPTLSIAGAAADAKATGELKSAISQRVDYAEAYLEPEELVQPLSKIEIDRHDYVYSTSGYSAATGWNTLKIHLPYPVLLKLDSVPDSYFTAVLKHDSINDNAKSYLGTYRFYTAQSDLYLSYKVAEIDLDNINIYIKKYKTTTNGTKLFYNDGFINPGVVQADGTVTYISTGGNVVQKIPVNGLVIHHDSNNYTIQAAAYDANDAYLGAVTKIGGRILSYPYGTAYILLTRSSESNLVYYDLLTIEPSVKYYKTTIVDKPFTFASANCIAFGDSIMLGYWGGQTHSEDAFIQLFANKAGVNNIKNSAVGGATYSTASGATSVISEVQGQNISTRDFIFISAGTNDYGRNVSISQLESDLSDLSTYINANKKETGKVIIITPFNRTAAPDGAGPALDEYRQSITNWALTNGYSVLNGEDMGMSPLSGAYMAAVTADGLHPNAYGHKIIANAMATILL